MEPIIDSAFASLEEAIRGTTAPPLVCATQVLLDVQYVSFDRRLHQGQLVIHKWHVEEVRDIFRILLLQDFPIERVVPIVAYDWDDERSMADNNSSGFCYRPIMGTNRKSNHSYGHAVDINPALNPYYKDGVMYPPNGSYDPARPGTHTPTSLAVRLFQERGWTWGGEWEDPVDLHHFEKLY